MGARRRLRLWLLAVAVLVAGGIMVATTRRAPRMPADASHRPDQSVAVCLTCHGYGKSHPRPATHPLRDDCYSCHRDASGVLHPRSDAPTSLPGGWRDDPRLLAKARR